MMVAMVMLMLRFAWYCPKGAPVAAHGCVVIAILEVLLVLGTTTMLTSVYTQADTTTYAPLTRKHMAPERDH